MSLHHITIREKIVVMIAVMSALFLVALDQTIIATALGAIVKEFNSFSSLGLVVTAYMLTTTVTVPIAGKLSDMYGRRPLLLVGVSVFTLGSLLSGMASNIEWLIGWRALQGVGGGIITANAFTIIGDLFPPRERGKWQGIIGAVFGMSSVIGPLLGGWLTDHQVILGLMTDWRWTFYVNVPIGIIAAWVIARYCPIFAHSTKHRPDYLGAMFITIALASLVLAVDNPDVVFRTAIQDYGWSLAAIKLSLFGLSALSAGLFALVEHRASQPILPLRFFRNRTYTLIISATLLFGAAFLGAILYLTQFNQQVFGASASTAGLMLLPMVGGMMVTAIGAGQIASRTGRYKHLMLGGFALATIAIYSLTALEPHSPYWHEAIRMVFVGMGMGMAMPLLNLAIQNEFSQKDLGAATASVQLFRGLGSTVGTAVLSGALTTGVIASLGSPSEISYVQTLRASPEASKMLEGEITADTLLTLNMQKEEIRNGMQKSLAASSLPPSVREAQVAKFQAEQEQFSGNVVTAFTNSLHHVFIISASLMAVATLCILLVSERELRADVHHASEV